MKRLFTILSTLALVGFTTPSLAKEIPVVNNSLAANQSDYINPFDLVNRGYRGYLSEQGIPSYSAFTNAVAIGTLDEVTLVEAAIARYGLTPQALEDQTYLHRVRTLLRTVNHH